MRLTLKALTAGAAVVAAVALSPESSVAQTPLRTESSWDVDIQAEIWAAPAGTATSAAYASLFAAVPAQPVLQRRKNKKTGVTLMIVGGGAFVGGLIIGDTGGTILAVAGLGVGAYGVYLYVD